MPISWLQSPVQDQVIQVQFSVGVHRFQESPVSGELNREVEKGGIKSDHLQDIVCLAESQWWRGATSSAHLSHVAYVLLLRAVLCLAFDPLHPGNERREEAWHHNLTDKRMAVRWYSRPLGSTCAWEREGEIGAQEGKAGKANADGIQLRFRFKHTTGRQRICDVLREARRGGHARAFGDNTHYSIARL